MQDNEAMRRRRQLRRYRYLKIALDCETCEGEAITGTSPEAHARMAQTKREATAPRLI